jgi:hypothetical protein
MSHDRSWRAACLIRYSDQLLHFYSHSIARGVTAVGVGSGALLGPHMLHLGSRIISAIAVWFSRRLRSASVSYSRKKGTIGATDLFVERVQILGPAKHHVEGILRLHD